MEKQGLGKLKEMQISVILWKKTLRASRVLAQRWAESDPALPGHSGQRKKDNQQVNSDLP